MAARWLSQSWVGRVVGLGREINNVYLGLESCALTPPRASPSSVKVQTSAPRPSRAARANRVCAVVRATPPTLHLLVQASRKPGRCVSLLAGNLRMQAVFIAVKALRWKVKCIGRFPRKRNEHAALASNAPPRCSYDAPK